MLHLLSVLGIQALAETMLGFMIHETWGQISGSLEWPIPWM